ncbi:hypothetical protein HPB47_020935 [Ixodes persulcatus]|uniref:Uncharacterized protein n=1 Tax=Ixodes persulcatus TaxID=34615 RepID=A0AC60QHC2_IXOPE|nr:hypothetical protein HPB47_020935 [Ixodes persulcatus]
MWEPVTCVDLRAPCQPPRADRLTSPAIEERRGDSNKHAIEAVGARERTEGAEKQQVVTPGRDGAGRVRKSPLERDNTGVRRGRANDRDAAPNSAVKLDSRLTARATKGRTGCEREQPPTICQTPRGTNASQDGTRRQRAVQCTRGKRAK